MSNVRNIDLGAAMLQRGRTPATGATTGIMPVTEMAMVLTLDQVRPNPDNPRTSRNPKYDEIKASIRARGLDSIPKVTRDPDGGDVYIFSDGGNTRYQILCELWQETGDERFYRIHTIFKPWPGRIKCVIGHLAENDVRGSLTYLEKAFGVHKARVIWEEQLSRPVTLRELSDLLNQEGYPIDNSSISRMEDTLDYLYPYMPRLLENGLSRGQVIPLLSLRSTALKVWKSFGSDAKPGMTLDDVFGSVCRTFNEPDSYSLEMFRDEFIGELIKALPHPSLNYDRWLIELDPKEQQRRKMFGDPPPTPPLSPVPDRSNSGEPVSGNSETVTVILPDDKTVSVPVTGLRSGTLTTKSSPEPVPDDESSISPLPESESISGTAPRKEIQPDLYGGKPVITGEEYAADTHSPVSLQSALDEGDQDSGFSGTPNSIAFASSGLEPVSDIWHIPALQDDIEHLKDISFRLAYELAEGMGCADCVSEDTSETGAGYIIHTPSSAFPAFLKGLTGNQDGCESFNLYALTLWLTGSAGSSDTPVFTDACVVKLMRLFRILRRLRELQRGALRKGSENGL